jgi:polysaccharide deacetylase 2 family uncharacterized protein YibQ
MSELSAPLAPRRVRRSKSRSATVVHRGLPVARLAFGAAILIIAAVALRVALVDDPEGGRPSATTAIKDIHHTNPIADRNSTTSPSIQIIEGPEVPAADVKSLTSGPGSTADSAGLDPELVEQTEFGAIPRMSRAGVRPFEAYAPASAGAATAAGKPMVAVVVTGLGINPEGTSNAIDKLPQDVTLAFAPYGKGLAQIVGGARAGGHEILLEVPLEPFDYPDNDPGPDTLLTGQAPRDNLNKLFKVMSRFGGYVGIINNMGARFTASGADFGPLMEELGARGLGYLDDGSSNRSLAPQLAKANRVPFNRADLMLDAKPARGPILEALAALEARAKANGAAIGVISALPISVEVLTEWTAGLDEQGIALVPVSVLMKDDDG